MAEYATLKDKIRAEKAEKVELQTRWVEICNAALAAGQAAGTNALPAPMIVGTPKNLLASMTGGNDGGFDPAKPTYYVSEGACGFAWVKFGAKAGEGRKFVNWLTGVAKPQSPELAPPFTARKSYGGGHDYWIGAFGQSVDRKSACARAMAEVIREAGIEGLSVYSNYRLD